MRILRDLEQALVENEILLRAERRVDRQIELLMVRTEIFKSMVHVLKQDMGYKEAA